MADNFIDESVARGFRQHQARRVRRIFDNQDSEIIKHRKSFEKSIREMMRHYREVFGPSYVHTIEVSKRGLEFIAITLSEGGPAVVQRNKFRISRGALVELSEDQENLQSYVPIILTAHCIERFLQSSRSGLATVADVMHQLWKAAQPHFILGFDGARDIYPVWSTSGRFAFGTKDYLVLGDIPEYQDMICRTVIRADRLEVSKAYLWERARQTQGGLLIQQSN